MLSADITLGFKSITSELTDLLTDLLAFIAFKVKLELVAFKFKLAFMAFKHNNGIGPSCTFSRSSITT